MPDLKFFEGWQLYICVEQYLCTHPKLDNMMYCLLEPFKDWPVLRHFFLSFICFDKSQYNFSKNSFFRTAKSYQHIM